MSIFETHAQHINRGLLKVTILNDNPKISLTSYDFGQNSLHLSIVNNATNLGMCDSFNRCIEISEGEFTLIMGQDDILMHGYFESLQSAIEGRNFFAFVPKVTEIDAHGDVLRTNMTLLSKKVLAYRRDKARFLELPNRNLLRRLSVGNFLYFPSIAFRTNIASSLKFQPRFGMVLDLDFICRAIFAGERFCFYQGQPLFAYRRHKQSDSSRRLKSGQRLIDEKKCYSWISSTAQSYKLFEVVLLSKLRLASRINNSLRRHF